MTTANVMVTDYDGIGWDALDRVTERIGASVTVHHGDPFAWRGVERPRVVLTFDGDTVRDAWVHGWACDAGYVAHIV